jgi:hypothetical protein
MKSTVPVVAAGPGEAEVELARELDAGAPAPAATGPASGGRPTARGWGP